jgi:hypothetical protein
VTPWFPVVYIRPVVTVKEHEEKHPFFWLVIRAPCSKSVARQEALGLEARKVLAREMLIEGTRSLDLLLGLMILASWCHFFMKLKKSPILTNVIQRAVGLASDVGLTKPYPEDPVRIVSDCRAYQLVCTPPQSPCSLQQFQLLPNLH